MVDLPSCGSAKGAAAPIRAGFCFVAILCPVTDSGKINRPNQE